MRPRSAPIRRPAAPGLPVLLLLLAAAQVGCSTGGIPRVEPGSEPSSGAPTGGMDFLLSIEDRRDGRFERFRLDRSGTLHYGGGRAALGGSETWSRPLTAEEIDAIVALLDAHGWWAELPRERGEPELFQWSIELASGRHRRKTWGQGDCPGVLDMQKMLRAYTAERFKPMLDRISPDPAATTSPEGG